MTLWRKLRHLLPWVRRAEERDMQEELRALEAIAGRRALGNLAIAAEDARAAFGWLWIERLGQDLRYAVRAMRHQRVFAATIVLLLGLAIGANTAIFSFTEAILLRALPVPDADQLVVMKWRAKGYALASSGMSWSTGGTSRADGVTLATNFPGPAVNVFAESRDVLSDTLAYFAADRLSVTSMSATDSVKGHYVSGGYFAGMRIAPAAGRLIHPDDDAPGRALVTVLSHEFSRRRFGNPAAAVGQTIRINDKPVLVVGVAPAPFFGAEPGVTIDLYLPLIALTQTSNWSQATLLDDHFYWIEIMGRLRPGVDLAAAQASLAPRFHQFVAGTADTEAQRNDLPVLQLAAGGAGLDGLRREYARPVLVLTTMVALILVIACANVANLLLARASMRRREIAVRLGMGAGRMRIVRQLLTESVLLAAMGGALGLAIAWWGIGVLTALLAVGRDHFTLHAALNWRVLALTAGLSAATGVLFGLVPALQATRLDIAPALKDARSADTSSSRASRGRLGPFLVGAQVALSLVLLVAAALFGRSLANLHAIDVGFNRDQVLLFTIRPYSVGIRPEATVPLFESLRERLAVLPGVTDVSLSTRPFPMGGGTSAQVTVDGTPQVTGSDGRPESAVLASAGPAFFRTMQIPITAGRDFADRDRAGATPVVIVNQQFLKSFAVTNPIGRSVVMRNWRTGQDDRWQIVGVADDSVAFALKEEDRWPILFFSYQQNTPPPSEMTYEVRAAGEPLDLAGAVRETVRQTDARLAVHGLTTQAAHVDRAISREITLARLGLLVAVLALVMAAAGLYGTVSFIVARRTPEIGIRMALGAPAPRIVRMVVGQVLLLAIAGLVAGLGLSVLGARYVASLLYGIEPTDPAAIAAAVTLLLACGALAAFAPARRATRIDPVRALRID